MRYSFIKARPKKLISSELRLVLAFFSVTLFMLFSTYAFLAYKSYAFSSSTQEYQTKILQLQAELDAMDTKIAFIKKEASTSERVFTANTVLKESIKNLFDLVPERITLSQAQLEEKALVLYGVTPNKEVYEFMLQAPLRSIFHRTYSSFYPLENGWYAFVSTNYLDDEEL